MIQGDLGQFELDFAAMRLNAEKEKETLTNTPTTLGAKPPCSLPAPDRQPADAGTDLPLPEHSEALNIMREQFSQMEVELVQLREQLDRQQPNSPTVSDFLVTIKREQDNVNSQLREFQQEAASQRRQLDYLSEEVKELRKDRDNCRTELATLREELQERDRLNSTQSLVPTDTPQTQTTPSQTQTTPAELQHSPFPEGSPPLTQPGATSSHLPVPASCLPTRIPSPASSHTPASVLGPASSHPPTSTVGPVWSSRPETTTAAAEATPHPDPTAETQQTHTGRRADIILLMDSNGKFLDEQTLFPRHRAEKIWCPNIRRALELLTVPELGSPSHIIIHTGTNDLRSQQDRVADSLRRVIEQASTTFPTSRIVISTLLQRRDFHPRTIDRVNVSLSRDCALKPNVFLAHHPTLDMDCLYDNIHLHREAVPTLARTLKDVALSRSLTATPRSNRTAQIPRRPPRPLQPSRPSRPPRYTHPRLSERMARSPHPPHHQHHNPQPSTQLTQHRPMIPSQRAPQPGGPASPLLPAAEPRLQEQQPIGQSYAAAVRGATVPPPSGDLREIQHMLNLLCSRLIATW